ncbi:metallophosphoesterase family protein [Dactylosporangium matsuzakiense]|uniref:Phosphohydrolase n=1 Tax=Dactylosporangium matsuzakiense TaxID=53360 RepID=A0A9W6KFD6_9ACTN|nr:metallophosphoesterase [Dactylosporangium matsuzakiense]GLK99225.1 phosphohydrolase [Dactylosporangium matsuzakiense]
MTTSPHGDPPLRLVQLSDTHLSRWDGPLRRNFRTLAGFVNDTLRPDLVIHAGDSVLSNPDAEEDFLAARELLGLIRAPMLFIPGNHDVGEPYERTWWTATADRVARYRRHFGPDRWLHWFGDVALIGLNSQIFGIGLAEEDEQWQWLAAVAREVEGRATIVFLHKSFWTGYCGSDGRQGAIDPADRDRILDILRGSRLLGVSNGDVHRYRKTWRGEQFELWGPSTAFLVHREETQKLPAGLEQLGVVLFEFVGEQVKTTFQTTPGLEEVEVGGFGESKLIRGEIRAAMELHQAAAAH